jgi:hypothetical protein
MTASIKRSAMRLGAPISIAAGAVVLRLLSGVGFVNYDTLYALAWGGQLARGQTPAYGVAIAPTPHPLVEILGVVLAPLSAHATEQVTVALAFLVLSACTWVIYRLGAAWFGRAAGALAGLIFITRVPVLEYGVRAYVDLPYLLLVLSALLVEAGAQQRRGGAAGWPVLSLLALAGLLRPEAWAFSGLYWLYLIGLTPSWARRSLRERSPQRRELADPTLGTSRGLITLTLLAAAAPLVWIVSDLAITGQPLWSLTNTRHTASTLGRETGIAKVPEYIPRRVPPSAGCSRCCGCVVAHYSGRQPASRPWSCSRPSPRSDCPSTRVTHSSSQRSCVSSAERACSDGPVWSLLTRGGGGGWPAVPW